VHVILGTTEYVTEIWKVALMVMPETIGIVELTMVQLVAENTFQIFLVI